MKPKIHPQPGGSISLMRVTHLVDRFSLSKIICVLYYRNERISRRNVLRQLKTQLYREGASWLKDFDYASYICSSQETYEKTVLRAQEQAMKLFPEYFS